MVENESFLWRALAFGLALVTAIDFIKDLVGASFAHGLQIALLLVMPAGVLWQTSKQQVQESPDEHDREVDETEHPQRGWRKQHKKEVKKPLRRKDREAVHERDRERHASQSSADTASRPERIPGVPMAKWLADTAAYMTKSEAAPAVAAAASRAPESAKQGPATADSDSRQCQGPAMVPTASEASSTRCPSSPAATTPRNISAFCGSTIEDVELLEAEFSFCLDWTDLQEYMPYRQGTTPEEVIDDIVSQLPIQMNSATRFEASFMECSSHAALLAAHYADCGLVSTASQPQVMYEQPMQHIAMRPLGVMQPTHLVLQQHLPMQYCPQAMQPNHCMTQVQSIAMHPQGMQPMQSVQPQAQYIPFGAGFITLPMEDSSQQPRWGDRSSWRQPWRKGGSSRRY